MDDRDVDDVRTFPRDAFPLEAVVAAKGGRTVSVCVPAHNEAATVARVVTAVRGPHAGAAGGSGLVDEVLVVDDGSTDETAEAATGAGARVVRLPRRVGKGGAMRAALEASAGDVLVFLDGDVENTTDAFVTSLLGPLFRDAGDVALVKGYYQRPIGDTPAGGGRVTELVAKPLLEVLFPEHPGLRSVLQPLAGETAAPRRVLEKVGFAPGYGVEIGLLVDVVARFGTGAVAQVDLGVRVHRNRTLDELRPQAAEVLRAALERAALEEPTLEGVTLEGAAPPGVPGRPAR
ncbi:MAG TPA: glucosyl-3-phosphoglycerate synthase [Acidimicrobiales bacterium]|nr:glucosyl-3-phosphoglycerate synthase [Acidimicrobiales bacterium]